MRWLGHVARMGIGTYGFLVGKSEEKRPRARPKRRWQENLYMDLQEVVWEGMDWIDLAQDRSR